MAINYRAGIGQIEQSGNIMGQGFAQMAQQQQQIGQQQQQASQQQMSLATASFQQQAQQRALKQQQGDQMMEAMQGAANTYAKVQAQKVKTDQEAIAGKYDVAKTEQLNIGNEEARLALATKKAQARAVVDENNSLLKGPPSRFITPDDYIPVDISDEDVIPKAKYILTQRDLKQEKLKIQREAADEARKTAADKRADDMFAFQKGNETYKRLQDDIAVNEKASADILKTTDDLALRLSKKDWVFENYSPEVKSAQKDAYAKTSESAGKRVNAKDILTNIFEVAGVKVYNPKIEKSDLENLAMALKGKLTDEQKAKLSVLEKKIQFSAKQPGMQQGGFTAAEYGMMSQMSGASAISNLRIIGETGTPFFDRLTGYFENSMLRTGNVVALGEKLLGEEERSLKDAMATISNNNGFEALTKSMRSDLMYALLPADRREQLKDQKMFSELSYDKQMKFVFGEDAKNINISGALKNDYINNNPQEAIENSIKANRNWKAEGQYLQQRDKTRLETQHRLLIDAKYAKTSLTKKNLENNGIIMESQDLNNYSDVNSSNVPSYIGNPKSTRNTIKTDPATGAIIPPNPRPSVNLKSFLKKKGGK